MPPGQLDRHARADVAAVGAEPLVAKPCGGQAAPQVGDGRLQEWLGERIGEAVARQRRDHDIERVLRPTSMALRVGQERQQVEVLDERAREAVREHDRQRLRSATALVHEMDSQPVDLGPEMRETVELLLDLAPVELGPAHEQRAHVLDVRAVLPARAGDVIRPACPLDPLAQIGEHVVVHGDGERLDLDRRSVCAATTRRVRAAASQPAVRSPRAVRDGALGRSIESYPRQTVASTAVRARRGRAGGAAAAVGDTRSRGEAIATAIEWRRVRRAPAST